MNATSKKKTKVQAFMDFIEKLGNKLPHPVLMFMYIAAFVLVLSAILGSFGVVAKTPLGDFPINNLLGQEPIEVLKVGANGTTVAERYSNGLSYVIGTAISNFMNMYAIGTILIIMLAIGLMDQSGYLSMAMKSIVSSTPSKLVTPVVIFLGVMSNMASDAGYVVLIPLAALMYYTLGRHPLVGLAAGFAGVSGGFSANLFVSSTDALLLPFTQAAAETGDAMVGSSLAGGLSVTSNWFFMMGSTLVIIILGTIVIDKFVEPRLGTYNKKEADVEADHEITQKEKDAYKFTNKILLLVIGLIVLAALPIDTGNKIPLVGDLSTNVGLWVVNSDGTATFNMVDSFLDSIFFKGDMVIMLMFVIFAISGLVYGFKSGKFKKSADIVPAMCKAMADMAPIIVILFFVAQFINYFNDSHLGVLVASLGADLVSLIPEGNMFMSIVLMVAFIFLTAFVNLFMGGASSKWGLLAPIFVPMLMVAGFSPAGVQLMYRIGDSSTNIISPLMNYLGVIVVFGQKYKKDFGVGNLMSMMMPISMAFLIGWTIFAIIWALTGIPIGPGTQFFL
ncbi:aminobenzoyl-glutamate transport protein [[Clostridium] sordellii]|uniref:AbgT family transporter n=1 Tax=Paraclostridium sordellii TaxID=1505 RepID=UPI0005434E16|nr:AbgT family transporter [Paeniclostridium sordellii]MDU6480478.1 AbgT family transporter [Paeniclostridium sordellii]CEK31405.1 aminobenzoyl-glutamate transport protein [[Clostridium] sordellii] [Paeniclostridium sordellii]CEN84933.1 aminobenzoyl-glutamate transport protein [[Clostridium] sordellii] [Paeniclostridium sordellii]CEO13111.1 aminobenzoyl-glutamate transport protein [[Clostridium] sordellii] [Paeniclostridium sordellii]CEP46986.1 aminobenzoyl-glutamate transport protein [[Clostr